MQYFFYFFFFPYKLTLWSLTLQNISIFIPKIFNMCSHIEFGMPVDCEVQQQVKLLFISVFILLMRDWSLILVI